MPPGQDQLRDLSRELARVWGNELLAQQPLSSWEAALTAIEQYASSERTVVVLDEFQYLAAQDRELASLLNRWWRVAGRHLELVLILAGSEVSFFEREILAGSMYGRRTGQWQLTPFDYRSAALFAPRYSTAEKVRTYAVCGGMPYYLERFRDDVPLAENILRHILYRDGFLHEEAELLLRQELSDPHNYFSTLRAIAAGKTRNSEIANWTGLDSAQVRQITSVLERLMLVEQRRPVTAASRSKKTTYAIVDGFLNFYFRFVDPYRSLLRTREGGGASSAPDCAAGPRSLCLQARVRGYLPLTHAAGRASRAGWGLVGSCADGRGPAHRAARGGRRRARRAGQRACRRKLQVDRRRRERRRGGPAHAPAVAHPQSRPSSAPLLLRPLGLQGLTPAPGRERPRALPAAHTRGSVRLTVPQRRVYHGD